MDAITTETPIGELMSKNVLVINEGYTFTQIQRLLEQMGVHHLPVVDDQKKLVGMVSANDILRALARSLERLDQVNSRLLNEELPIHEVMTPRPLWTARESSTVGEAAKRMAEQDIHALPVVDESEKVVGIFTSHDIVQYCAKNLS